jgi:Domain of unknown function (DUF4259)
MGTWGVGNFENDQAADYLNEVLDQDEFDFLKDALETAVAGEPDAHEAAEALVAAEVLCAACGAPADDASEDLLEWAEERKEVPGELIALGLKAIAAIRESSELRELWEETDHYDDWIGTIDDTESRLSDFA